MLVARQVKLGLFVSGDLLHGVVNPNLDFGVTAARNELQTQKTVTIVSLQMLTEVKSPDLLIVHLERVLAHLLLDVPDFYDTIDTS